MGMKLRLTTRVRRQAVHVSQLYAVAMQDGRIDEAEDALIRKAHDKNVKLSVGADAAEAMSHATCRAIESWRFDQLISEVRNIFDELPLEAA